jgi:hypothetical protein
MYNSNARDDNDILPDQWYWDIYRKDLRKLINRFVMGLETLADTSATIGILSMFLKSNDMKLIAEARRYLKLVPLLQKYFPDQKILLY